MPTQLSGARAAAATLALNAYTQALAANNLPLAVSTGDLSNTNQAGAVSFAIKMLTSAGVIVAPGIIPVPLLAPLNNFIPEIFLIESGWTPNPSQTAAQLQSKLAKALETADHS